MSTDDADRAAAAQGGSSAERIPSGGQPAVDPARGRQASDPDRQQGSQQGPEHGEGLPEVRQVVQPDLLWIESVTERLLGTAARPATWERVYFEVGEEPVGSTAESTAESTAGSTAEFTESTAVSTAELTAELMEPAPGGGADLAAPPAGGVPVGTPPTPSVLVPAVRGYVPAAHVGAAEPDRAEPDPAEPDRAVDSPPTASAGEPSPYFPPLARPAAGPTVPVPVPVLTQARHRRPEPAREPSEDMPPALLRAALRDALPADVGRRPSPADAIFGDPSWQLPPEPDEPEDDGPQVSDLGVPDIGPLAEETPAEETPAEEAPTPGAPAEEDPNPGATAEVARDEQSEPGPTPAAPVEAAQVPPRSTLGYPRPVAELEPGDLALRLAFLSGDQELAEAVVGLVGAQSRDRQRLRMVEAYLDALLDEGGEALPGAARLRRLLRD